MYYHSRSIVFATLITTSLSAFSQSDRDASAMEEIIITAALMKADSARLSATTIDQRDMAVRGATHLEDLLTLIPNVSASAGASRQRFFQIRGIGERSQFVEPTYPSVVVLQDGIDISGLGGALTTFDTQQVDVLRGPQGVIMGAGALAGLISVNTVMPNRNARAEVTLGMESHNGQRASFVGNTPLTETLSVRVAHQHYQSDGWISNTHLNRRDTNNRDEETTRLALRYDHDRDTVDVSVNRVDTDNGYDAFSLDNTRETLSDEPGQDRLDLTSARLRWRHRGDVYTTELQVSDLDAESLYSFDEDWSFEGIAPDWEYRSFDAYARHVERSTLDWRLTPSDDDDLDWVVGLYGRRDDEALDRDYTYLDAPFNSVNKTDTVAVYGQISQAINETLTLTVGARLEQREVTYSDSAEVVAELDDEYWTGNATLEWQASSSTAVYATLSRGVRAGGINATLSSTLLTLADEVDLTRFNDRTQFDEETLVNTEFGWRFRSPDARVSASVSLFNMDRRDQQVSGSVVIERDDGSTSFTDFTDNAASGTNRGLEAAVDWTVSEALTLNASFARLDADFDTYVNVDGTDLSGRDQPQAPNWQYRLSARWAFSEDLSATLEATGRDAYYLSDRHEVRSPSADLINATVAWRNASWSISLWGRNLSDQTTVTRGFGTFGNDPRKEYALEPYYQYGEPRTVGATVSYQFGE